MQYSVESFRKSLKRKERKEKPFVSFKSEYNDLSVIVCQRPKVRRSDVS